MSLAERIRAASQRLFKRLSLTIAMETPVAVPNSYDQIVGLKIEDVEKQLLQIKKTEPANAAWLVATIKELGILGHGAFTTATAEVLRDHILRSWEKETRDLYATSPAFALELAKEAAMPTDEHLRDARYSAMRRHAAPLMLAWLAAADDDALLSLAQATALWAFEGKREDGAHLADYDAIARQAGTLILDRVAQVDDKAVQSMLLATVLDCFAFGDEERLRADRQLSSVNQRLYGAWTDRLGRFRL